VPKNIYHYEVTIERVRREPPPGEEGEDKTKTTESEPKQGPPSKEAAKETEKPNKKGTKGNKSKKGDKDGAKGKPKPDDGGGDGGDVDAAAGPPRKMPKPFPQLVLQVVLKRIRTEMKFYGIVTDYSNNLYSTKPLEGNVSMELIVSMKHVDQTILQETDDGEVKVKIERSQLHIDTSGLQQQLEKFRSFKDFSFPPNLKTPIEMVYNAVLKSMPNFRFLALPRTLAIWPEEGGSALDWRLDTWKGMSSNIHMGWQPYLNVDSKQI